MWSADRQLATESPQAVDVEMDHDGARVGSRLGDLAVPALAGPSECFLDEVPGIVWVPGQRVSEPQHGSGVRGDELGERIFGAAPRVSGPVQGIEMRSLGLLAWVHVASPR